MKSKAFLILIIGFLGSSFIHTKDNIPVTDFLGIPGPIYFDGTYYPLIWSAHPTDAYFSQEYLPAKEKLKKYKKLVLIEAFVSDLTLEDAVRAKMVELEERKKNDVVLNYKLFENHDKSDYMLDFIVSTSADDALTMVEWNAYRYEKFTDKSGRVGILLFGISMRSYSGEITDFMNSLGSTRKTMMHKFGEYQFPQIILPAEH
jgi:hypothetical protein